MDDKPDKDPQEVATYQNGTELFINTITGEIRDPRTLPEIKPIDKTIFAPHTAEIICSRLRQGESLKYVTSLQGYPTADIVAIWRRRHSHFDEMVRQAMKDRGEWARDTALETAQEVFKMTQAEGMTKDVTAAAKNLVDVLKWSAEKDDPERFGNKTKVIGDANAPVSFVIDTGIRRSQPEETPAIEMEEAVVVETIPDPLVNTKDWGPEDDEDPEAPVKVGASFNDDDEPIFRIQGSGPDGEPDDESED